MSTLQQIVILGTSHAGVELAASLRAEGYDGALTMLSAEPELPYQRPPLSKAFLKATDSALLPLRPAAFYGKRAIDLRLGVAAVAIDRSARQIQLADGTGLAYDRLALTTGARLRRPAVPGIELAGIVYLRSAADAVTLRTAAAAATAIAVIGGGFIGLEVAATLAGQGKQVTLLEAAPRLMARAVPPVISEHALTRQRQWGVDVRLNAPLGRILGSAGKVSGIETVAGERFAAELVVIGIGVLPETELAAAAGLVCADGIAVAATMATSDPTIVAAGDGVSFPYPALGRRLRLESVQNAVDQAKTAARTLLGRRAPYQAVPWFWSDQGDIKLQTVGLAEGAELQVLRGAPEEGRFSVFHYRGDRLQAIDSVGRPADHLLGRRMLAAGYSPPPAAVADMSVDLKALFEDAIAVPLPQA